MLDTNENVQHTPSMEERLQELATNGIGCKAEQKSTYKKSYTNDPTFQVGNIVYRFYSSAQSIVRALRNTHPKHGIDVLAFGHNCLQRQTGIMKFLAPRVPGLVEADKATGTTHSKLGTFCGVRYDTKSEKDAFVTSLYVQFATGIPNKAKEDYKPPYQGKYHISPKSVSRSLTTLANTFRDRKIGIVMFGHDPVFPTPWEIIESAIEEACARSNITVTVFVPLFALTQNGQELSPKLKEAARSVGYAFV